MDEMRDEDSNEVWTDAQVHTRTMWDVVDV